MNTLKRVQAFITEELGTIDMDTSKQEIITMLQENNIKYRETPRTITVKNRDRTNMMYFIFSDELDRIILADMCSTELDSLVIDGERLFPDDIRANLKWKHVMKCDYLGKKFEVNSSFKVRCNAGIDCRMCTGAGPIKHEAFLQDSIVTYIDFGDATNNRMFCIENNEGKPVKFRKIRREDVKAMKQKKIEEENI